MIELKQEKSDQIEVNGIYYTVHFLPFDITKNIKFQVFDCNYETLSNVTFVDEIMDEYKYYTPIGLNYLICHQDMKDDLFIEVQELNI